LHLQFELHVELNYAIIDKNKKLSDVMDEFYKKPLGFLGLCFMEGTKQHIQDNAHIHILIQGNCLRDGDSTGVMLTDLDKHFGF